MLLEKIDFGIGVIQKYIDFDVDENKPLEEQLELLKEDLLQVTYENNYTIDVGWYPEFKEEGSFKVYLIHGYDWEDPIRKISCRQLDTLVKCLHECVHFIQEKLH